MLASKRLLCAAAVKLAISGVAMTWLVILGDSIGAEVSSAPSKEGSERLAEKLERISLSDEEMDKFLEKRREYYIPLFGERLAQRYLSRDREIGNRGVAVSLESPKMQIRLAPKQIDIEAANMGEMLPYFPEITWIRLDLPYGQRTLPDSFFGQVEKMKCLDRITLAGKMSDEAMSHISRCPKVRNLEYCNASEKGLRYLENLRTLERVYLGCVTPKVFLALSKLPRIQYVEGTFGEEPIDDDTYRAIVSLDGRLKGFAITEYSYASVDVSLARPFLHMKSLETLWLYGVNGLRPSDCDALPELTHLTCFHLSYFPNVSEEQKKIGKIVDEVEQMVEMRTRKEE